MKYERQFNLIMDYFNSITQKIIEVYKTGAETRLENLKTESQYKFQIFFDSYRKCFVFQWHGAWKKKKNSKELVEDKDNNAYDKKSEEFRDKMTRYLVLNFEQIKSFYNSLIKTFEQNDLFVDSFVG